MVLEATVMLKPLLHMYKYTSSNHDTKAYLALIYNLAFR